MFVPPPETKEESVISIASITESSDLRKIVMLPVPIFTFSENDNSIFDRCEAEVSSSAGVALINVGARSLDDVLNENVVLSDEHCEFQWVDFDTAHDTLVWNGQKEGIAAVFNMLNSNDDRIKWSEISF